VLVDPATLGLAAVFLVACIGGKLLAALACRPRQPDPEAGTAGADVGLVRPVYIVADGAPPPEQLVEEVEREITYLALDADIEIRHDRSVTDGCCTAPTRTTCR
jgi:hypothetical protein